MIAPGDPALFLVNKPPGPTSHDIIQHLRRWTATRRVGHSGTLDPLASGLLPVAVGNATRLLEYVGELPKTYTATIRLGIRTDTDDAQGQILDHTPVPPLTRTELDAALEPFRGEITQRPPAYSAVKVGGVTAHRAARSGQPLRIEPRRVTIHQLRIDDWTTPDLHLTLRVSSGTYIRAIARDLGDNLGCGGHITAIERTAIGPLTLNDAHPLSELQTAFETSHGWDRAVSPTRLLDHWPHITLNNRQRLTLLNGKSVEASPRPPSVTHLLAIDRHGAPLAVLIPEPVIRGHWRPIKVLATRRA